MFLKLRGEFIKGKERGRERSEIILSESSFYAYEILREEVKQDLIDCGLLLVPFYIVGCISNLSFKEVVFGRPRHARYVSEYNLWRKQRR